MPWLERLIRLLLRTHPQPVRERYGDEIADVALERARSALQAGGVLAAARVAARECAGIVGAGVRWRLRAGRARTPKARTNGRRRGGTTLPMNLALHHLRIAARGLWRQPAFSLVAVSALALGIGASIAIFTVFHAIVLRPLPFRPTSTPSLAQAAWNASADIPGLKKTKLARESATSRPRCWKNDRGNVLTSPVSAPFFLEESLSLFEGRFCGDDRRKVGVELSPSVQFVAMSDTAFIGVTSLPIPSISISTTSPGLRNCGGFRPAPTPSGVPLEITSPG